MECARLWCESRREEMRRLQERLDGAPKLAGFSRRVGTCFAERIALWLPGHGIRRLLVATEFAVQLLSFHFSIRLVPRRPTSTALPPSAMMATGAPSSPLLALPSELRLDIIKLILNPDPSKSQQLYHDRRGSSLDLTFSILLVNRQIHLEALPLLYNTPIYELYLATPVVSQCGGGYYPDRGEIEQEPPALFGTPKVPRLLKICGPDHSEPGGLIYPHCFRKLRHIKIITSKDAIFGASMCGPYFSHIGELILQILRHLAKESASTGVGKSLDVLVLSDDILGGWRDARPSLLGLSKEDIPEKPKEMIKLLKKVGRVRKISVNETVVADGKLQDRDVNLDSF